MENMAKYIDSTSLSHKTTRKEINKLVSDAIEHKFFGVCVAPCWTSYVSNKVKNTDIKVITVPNFKLGGGMDQFVGIGDSVCDTCDEVDFIWNCYDFSTLDNDKEVLEELQKVRDKVKGKLKVIIEANYLRLIAVKLHKKDPEEVLEQACAVVNKSGADFIKTDSGLYARTDFKTLLEDSKTLVNFSKIPVKAAGGVKTYPEVKQLIDTGVSRVGTSKATHIMGFNI